MAKNKVMVQLFLQKVECIKATGGKIRCMDMALSYSQVEISIQENSLMIRNMVLVSLSSPMALSTKASMLRIKNMVREPTTGLTARLILASGSKTRSTEEE